MPIAAISTPPGQGAIAVLRLSGEGALAVADAIFRGAGGRSLQASPARRAVFGTIVDGAGEKVDEVLATAFRGPASYTGEDLVEISCHGGVLVTGRILELLLENGATAAEPGEFTQRAFLNGKMDLTQAEAVMDLIEAQTTLALRAANEQLSGRIGSAMMALRGELLGVLAHLEAYIDFPEEDIDPDTGSAMLDRIESARAAVARLIATAEQGRILREGARAVICGPPNVGKSSLLNVLLGFERAIVSDIAGTTRDTIEEVINVRGLPLRLVDTAGVRASTDAIEREGIARAERQIAEADIVLEIADASLPPGERISAPPGRHHLFILNKADLGEHAGWSAAAATRLSCKTGAGTAELADAIFAALTAGSADWGAHLVAINARHKSCLARARADLGSARDAFAAGQPPEIVALELRSALDAIGEVVGKADSDELLGVIFGRFCIGK
ncbi:MAG: tRNA uridine-5-carboxymethylaminomethyl(34) synthesis GTPase MnmE [Verrucomicrobiales bacterium]